jgi:hypothetical protein
VSHHHLCYHSLLCQLHLGCLLYFAKKYLKNLQERCWAPLSCNPSYSGGTDQDCGSKPAGQIVLRTLSQKSPSQR